MKRSVSSPVRRPGARKDELIDPPGVCVCIYFLHIHIHIGCSDIRPEGRDDSNSVLTHFFRAGLSVTMCRGAAGPFQPDLPESGPGGEFGGVGARGGRSCWNGPVAPLESLDLSVPLQRDWRYYFVRRPL